MNTVLRQIMIGVGYSLMAFLLAISLYLAVYPLSDWTILWDKEILDLPFVLFAICLSIAVGILYGIISGIFWRTQLLSVAEALQQLEQGKQIEVKDHLPLQELGEIWNRLDKVQKQLAAQTKLFQKLASEKSEEQEKRIQEIVSQERNRLARELHDSVSQQLFAASMLMSAINESKPLSDDRETKQLKLVEEMIHQSQLEMRALLLHLRPVALKGKSLQEGIKELLVELSQKVPIDIEWNLEPVQMEKGVEDHLFRILQESVSNTLRHAKAKTLEVLLIERDGLIILRVMDDGIGFDVEESKTGSYGLQNMYERALEIGGTLKIVSVKNKGTRLEVRVPIMKGEGEADDSSVVGG